MKVLCITIVSLFLVFGGVIAAQRRPHPDYVPNKETAAAIAEAVLVGQFGRERVNAQLPFLVYEVKGTWLVQGMSAPNSEMNNCAVWVNKHSGCIENVVNEMK